MFTAAISARENCGVSIHYYYHDHKEVWFVTLGLRVIPNPKTRETEKASEGERGGGRERERKGGGERKNERE